MTYVICMLLDLCLPLLAVLAESRGTVRMGERYHSSHDTYGISPAFTHAVVNAMLLMGAFGIVVSSLCTAGLLVADPVAVLGFFDAFLVVSFVMCWIINRYRISMFENCLIVTPVFGPRIVVMYDQIDRLEWKPSRFGSGVRDLRVWSADKPLATLRAFVDLRRVLAWLEPAGIYPQNTDDQV